MDHDDVIERHPDDGEDAHMDVILVRISDGERRLCLPSWKNHYTWADEYWWTEGNQGCEGNRHDEWHMVNDLPQPEDHECGSPDIPKRYYVILRSPTYYIRP